MYVKSAAYRDLTFLVRNGTCITSNVLCIIDGQKS